MIGNSDWFNTCNFFCFACSWLRCWGSRSHWSYRMDWIYRTYWINWLWFWSWLRGWLWFWSRCFFFHFFHKCLVTQDWSRQFLPCLIHIFDVLDKDFSIWINCTDQFCIPEDWEAISATIQEVVDNRLVGLVAINFSSICLVSFHDLIWIFFCCISWFRIGVLDPCHLQEVKLFLIILLVQSFVDLVSSNFNYLKDISKWLHRLSCTPSYCSVWFHHEVCTDSSIVGEGKVNIWITWFFGNI